MASKYLPHRFIFHHIPKNGGASIANRLGHTGARKVEELVENHPGWKAFTRRQWDPKYPQPTGVWWHAPLRIYDPKVLQECPVVAAVFRDPADRAYSIYKMAHEWVKNPCQYEGSPEQRKEKFPYIREGISFRQWLDDWWFPLAREEGFTGRFQWEHVFDQTGTAMLTTDLFYLDNLSTSHGLWKRFCRLLGSREGNAPMPLINTCPGGQIPEADRKYFESRGQDARDWALIAKIKARGGWLQRDSL